MARGVTLGNLVDSLRSEIAHSAVPALGQNFRPVLVRKLQAAQSFLYEDHFWDFFKVRGNKTLSAGSRYYDVPTEIGATDRIVEVRHKWAGVWSAPLPRGITMADYSAYDSDEDVRADPVLKWDVISNSGTAQIEVWPLPATNQTSALRFIGRRPLANALSTDAHTCDIDSELLILWAAADLLTRAKASEATSVQARAVKLYNKLKGNNARRTQTYSFADVGEEPTERRSTILVAQAS